ncbi:hypothetical protein chiPu_0029283 [Chiloscyllium punctatum]|uniref:Uncharacterized protein n=1 Tax=Chiloscyllium punctatum TaxID=137246 RepID=A0A401TRE0_CHIPU|nr:hypothetical protein [Chiloscyllium punctatum]
MSVTPSPGSFRGSGRVRAPQPESDWLLRLPSAVTGTLLTSRDASDAANGERLRPGARWVLSDAAAAAKTETVAGCVDRDVRAEQRGSERWQGQGKELTAGLR